MKKLVLSVIVLFLALSVFAQKSGRVIISESDLEFSFNDDLTEVTITRFKYDRYDDAKKKYDGKVIEIPSKIQGIPVTAIGNGAFTYKGDNISGLWIPNSVTKISSYAFDSSYFPSIRLPDGLKTITVGMFQSCKAKSVTIPSSVTRIRSHAFSGSQIESISIPKDCIIEGGTGDLMSAFQDCSKLKTVTFPSGRVYFAARPIDPNNNWMWSGEGVFRECNSLVSIVIPKGFEAVYISESDFADHTLVEYFSGEKIKTSAATLKTLKSVKVRNAALVDHEAYLAAYNQAFKSGDYTRAQFLAKQFMENYSYYKSAEWTKRYTDIAEKKYLDDYNKAVASKDLQKAKKIINDFRGKISSDSSLSSLESKWDDMLFDVDCKMYLPAYVEKLEKKGSVVYLNSSLQFKIPLTEDVYENPRFNFTDSDGNGLWNTGYTLFLKKIKEFTGKDYQIYDSYSNPYLYRNATAEEVTKYNQVRKDAVKYFMERAVNSAVIEKDGSNSLLKIYLAKDTYSYSNYTFTVKNASGTAYTLSDKDFLAYAKEVCGTEYKLNGYYSGSYLYRNATSEEITTYNQVRKDAVKYFMEEATKNGTVEKEGSNLLFKIYLSKDAYSYNNDTFTVKNSSGTAYTVSDKDFLAYAKEVCGTEYNLYGRGSYLYRNATSEEIAAYHQPRKDAVKFFMEEAVKNGTVEKDGSNLLLKIYLSKDTYSYNNDTFTVKNSSGTAYTVSDKDFLAYAKDVCGTEYKLYGRGSYLYRNATSEEAAPYHQPRKDALKPFLDDVMKGAKFEKQDSNLLFKIYFPYLSYNYNSGSYSFKDSSGKTYTVDGTYFLSYVKEICGASYELSVNGNTNSYLYRNATDEEISAYQQPRKDAVKQFMDRALNVAVIEKDGSNSLLKIYLADDTYSYGNDSFYMIDSSGNKYTLSDKDFLAYAKEVCGTEYKLHGYYSGSYLYRNATDEEIAAYNQVRKDAVKYFMEETVKNAVVEKGSSNYVFKIYLSKEAYSYNNDTFTVKDASGTVYTVSDKDFLVYAKEVCGTEYNLYGRGSYLYRNATSEEIAAYNQPRKDAVKYFMDVAEKKGRVEKDGSNLLFKIYLSESTYNYNKDTFSVKDSSGNVYTVSSNDFLDYAKEAGGIEYKLYATSRNPYLYATTNDMLNFKYNFALQNGSLHTNLACKLKDGWACAVEFEESKGVVSVKSFKVKKSVFENNGLAQKDVLKKIVMSDASGTETEVSREDLLKIPALCTLTFTVERGKGKKAKTFIVRIPVEWNMDEMKNVKDIVDFKCLMAFTSGKLHTNLACAVDKKWMCVAEFAEANNGVIIKSFRSKKSALEKNGLKTKDVIKSIVMTDGAGTETELGLSDLLKVQAPCTVTFTVERGSGKKVQLVTVSVPVEWNPEELGNIW